jgi:hypothetical protein
MLNTFDRRRAALGAGLAVALCTVLLLAAGPRADAAATNCLLESGGTVCNVTNGFGRYVGYIGATRNKFSWSYICDYSADISVLDGRNHARVKFFRHVGPHNGCTALRAWFRVDVGRYFANGDVTSVRWYEEGLGGTPQYANVTIRG